MSEEGLRPVKTRYPISDIKMAFNETSDALREMFPEIWCNAQIGTESCQLRFDMGNPDTFMEFVNFLCDAATHAHVRLIPKKIIYSGPATIVLWADGTKTVVKCSDEDAYAPEAGFLWALAEKVYGSKSQVDKVMRRWLRDAGQE